MKKRHPSNPLQTLGPDDLGYIRHLAAEHSAGLEQRCAQYRHRIVLRRYVIATCIFLGCSVSYSSAISKPLYDQINTNDDVDSQEICDIIQLSIKNIS